MVVVFFFSTVVVAAESISPQQSLRESEKGEDEGKCLSVCLSFNHAHALSLSRPI